MGESESRFRFALTLDGTIQGCYTFSELERRPYRFYLYEVQVLPHPQIITQATTS